MVSNGADRPLCASGAEKITPSRANVPSRSRFAPVMCRGLRNVLLFSVALLLSVVCSAQDVIMVVRDSVSNERIPFPNNKYTWTEMIYRADEIGRPGVISSISFQLTTPAYASYSMGEINVYMAERSSMAFSSSSDWTYDTDLTLVYSSPNHFANDFGSWHTYWLQTPYNYSGDGNLVVIVARKSNYSTTPLFKCHSDTYSSVLSRSSNYFSNYGEYSRVTGSLLSSRPNMRLTMECDYEIWSREVSNITATSADISWTDSSSATQWTVKYGTSLNRLNQHITTDVPQVTLTNLMSDTYYYFTVKNNANTNDSVGRCSSNLSFHTLCDTIGVTLIHDVATGRLVVDTGSCIDTVVLTGATSDVNNYVVIKNGFHGTVVLRNLNMNFLSQYGGNNSPIRVEGSSVSNMSANTEVNFILDGNNSITNLDRGRACIQVDQGTTVRFSAIDPDDNSSGTLCVKQLNQRGGAAIGSIERSAGSSVGTFVSEPIYSAPNIWGQDDSVAGGNIVISSGLYMIKGGHGAGIGGGHGVYYDGMILIYGGEVRASTIYHAAGIGSGCPTGAGVVANNTLHSSIIVLPPAHVEAVGAMGANQIAPSLGLAGSRNIVYIGDPNSPLIRIRTSDYRPNVGVYLDLSKNETITNVIQALVDSLTLDISAIRVGTTDSTGVFSFHGVFQDSTIIFTDAVSESGMLYEKINTVITDGGTVVLNPEAGNMAMPYYRPDHLLVGYSDAEAQNESHVMKITYSSPLDITDITFRLNKGDTSDFQGLEFYGPDSTSAIAPPTQLTAGDVVYVRSVLKPDKPVGGYDDVLHMECTYANSTKGIFEQRINQYVVCLDTIMLCDSTRYTLPGGNVVTATGLYFDTISTSYTIAGYNDTIAVCNNENLIIAKPDTRVHQDSVSYHYVEFNMMPKDTLVARICDSIMWMDSTFFVSGNYHYPYLTEDGYCDSMHYLSLGVYPSYNDTIVDEGCQGTVYEILDFTVDTTGVYTHYNQSIHQCDSVSVLDFTIHPSYNDTIVAYTCDLPYAANGFYAEESGIYHRYLSTVQYGCDSLRHLIFKRNPVYNDTAIGEIYYDQIYTGYDFHENTEGFYIHQYTDENGCDSIQNLDLRVIHLRFPNMVTPNGDGINDVYEVIDLCRAEMFNYTCLWIYDRTGRKIFEKENIRSMEDFWDPNKTGSPTGTYFFRFVGRALFRVIEHKGVIEVLR